jgi:hypothetical protein
MKVKELLEAKELVDLSADPVFGNDTMNRALMHYMGPQVYWWAQDVTPYNPNSPYKAYKNLYTRIVNSITPEMSKPDPNMELVVKTINKQIPIVNLPSWVKKQIDLVVANDKANPPEQGDFEFVGL